jgi:hypothetical protein
LIKGEIKPVQTIKVLKVFKVYQSIENFEKKNRSINILFTNTAKMKIIEKNFVLRKFSYSVSKLKKLPFDSIFKSNHQTFNTFKTLSV